VWGAKTVPGGFDSHALPPPCAPPLPAISIPYIIDNSPKANKKRLLNIRQASLLSLANHQSVLYNPYNFNAECTAAPTAVKLNHVLSIILYFALL